VQQIDTMSEERNRMNEEDRRLLEECRAGDDEAWRKLYAMTLRLTRSVASKWFKPPDIDDIAHEILPDLIKAVKENKIRTSLRAFIKRIANNKCVDFFRKKDVMREKAQPDGDGNDPVDQVLVRDPPVTLTAGVAELLERIRLVIADMDEPCKSILKLWHWGKKKHKEIGGLLELPTEQIGTRIKRCRTPLLTTLRALYPDIDDEIDEALNHG